jgi:hypothetical protein
MQLLKVFLPPSLNAKTCQDFATYKGGQKGNSTMIYFTLSMLNAPIYFFVMGQSK